MALGRTLAVALVGLEGYLVEVESHLAASIPAFTIVDECRYALAGVGAAIALGNHTWNGNCADFVNAPARISSSIGTYSGSA